MDWRYLWPYAFAISSLLDLCLLFYGCYKYRPYGTTNSGPDPDVLSLSKNMNHHLLFDPGIIGIFEIGWTISPEKTIIRQYTEFTLNLPGLITTKRW